jgi:hypothetical protein
VNTRFSPKLVFLSPGVWSRQSGRKPTQTAMDFVIGRIWYLLIMPKTRFHDGGEKFLVVGVRMEAGAGDAVGVTQRFSGESLLLAPALSAPP